MSMCTLSILGGSLHTIGKHIGETEIRRSWPYRGWCQSSYPVWPSADTRSWKSSSDRWPSKQGLEYYL